MPDNGRISNVCIRERHNTHGVTLRLPELLIENNRFRTHLSITEDSLPTQQWTLSGQLSPRNATSTSVCQLTDASLCDCPTCNAALGQTSGSTP